MDRQLRISARPVAVDYGCYSINGVITGREGDQVRVRLNQVAYSIMTGKITRFTPRVCGSELWFPRANVTPRLRVSLAKITD